MGPGIVCANGGCSNSPRYQRTPYTGCGTSVLHERSSVFVSGFACAHVSPRDDRVRTTRRTLKGASSSSDFERLEIFEDAEGQELKWRCCRAKEGAPKPDGGSAAIGFDRSAPVLIGRFGEVGRDRELLNIRHQSDGAARLLESAGTQGSSVLRWN